MTTRSRARRHACPKCSGSGLGSFGHDCTLCRGFGDVMSSVWVRYRRECEEVLCSYARRKAS